MTIIQKEEPMSDYRIGDEVYIHGIIDEIRKDTIIIKNEGGYFGTVADEIMPSAQAERKKGRWLPVRECDGGYWVCSSCKNPTEAFAANVLYKYCPFCGADMRKQKLQYGDEDTSQGGLMSAT